jgi:hypothetical protein
MNEPFIQFVDGLVSYGTMVRDIGAYVVRALKSDKDDPDFVSQRTAYKMFGRANVERWRKLGLVEPYERPGVNEYRTADLRYLQRIKKDKKK